MPNVKIVGRTRSRIGVSATAPDLGGSTNSVATARSGYEKNAKHSDHEPADLHQPVCRAASAIIQLVEFTKKVRIAELAACVSA